MRVLLGVVRTCFQVLLLGCRVLLGIIRCCWGYLGYWWGVSWA